ncbi:MAG: hypothetical protein B6U73_00030 [Desulfurococcales archaeon ex4484_204]|nr:MAG: hypothetical protein B6U73_00030 [Desulfurococcales archaeon ex4484_204]
MIGRDAEVRIAEAYDAYGQRVYTFRDAFPPSPSELSRTAAAVPIPAPMARPAYMFIRGSELVMTIEATKSGTVDAVAEGGNRSLMILYPGMPNSLSKLGLTQASVRVEEGVASKYRVMSAVLNGTHPYRITLNVSPAGQPFAANFSIPGCFMIHNMGGKPVALSAEFIRYGIEGNQSATYEGLEVGSGDTIIVTPRSWGDLGRGLIVKIDEGSDGTIDKEVVVGRGGRTVVKPSTTTKEETKPPERSTSIFKLPRWVTSRILIVAAAVLIMLIAAAAAISRRK